jgi:hypothetical protein
MCDAFKVFRCLPQGVVGGCRGCTYLYGGVLLSTPLHASSNFRVSVQLANKRGFKPKKSFPTSYFLSNGSERVTTSVGQGE